MSKQSARQLRRELDSKPIDVDELLNDPALKGLPRYGEKMWEEIRPPEGTVLARPASSPLSRPSDPTVVVPTTVVPTTVDSHAFDSANSQMPVKKGMSVVQMRTRMDPTTVVPTTVDPTTVESPGGGQEWKLVPPTVVPTTVVPTTVETPTAWISHKGISYETRRTTPIRLAQNTMTHLEEAVYNRLMSQRSMGPFRVLKERDQVSRLFQAGYDILADILSVSEKTVRKSLLPSLMEKLILERKELSASCKGSIYELFSYEQILNRQRAAGYIRTIRNGRAVDLVRQVSGDPTTVVTTTVETPSREPQKTVPTTVDTSTVTVGARSTVTTVGTPTVSLDKTSSLENPSSNDDDEAPADLISRLEGLIGPVDEWVPRMLWQSCRRISPDTTVSEIAYLLEAQIHLLKARRVRVNNPPGFLIGKDGERVELWFNERGVKGYWENLKAVEQDLERRLAETTDESEKRILREVLGIQQQGTSA